MTEYCDHCGQPKRQEGRYGDHFCECCDRSAKCPHVSAWTRLMRKLSGRKV